MKLTVWNEALDLFGLTHSILTRIDGLDFKLRAQILDATQSVSANIAEGYCRRSLNEYLQYLNVALGSSGEALTRMTGLRKAGYVTAEQFEEFDKLHYAIENRLIALVRSLQSKRRSGTWEDEFKESTAAYAPQAH